MVDFDVRYGIEHSMCMRSECCIFTMILLTKHGVRVLRTRKLLKLPQRIHNITVAEGLFGFYTEQAV